MALNRKRVEWSEQRVWILGASSGIGAALARALHRRGARVALSARRADALATLAAELGDGRALALPVDVVDAAAVVAAESRLTAAWGGYDMVVLMAGDYLPMHAWELDLARAERMLDINLRGALHALAAVVPRFLSRGQGAITLVASVAGYRGLPKSLVYGPTKAALINLAESLYLDLHPRGVDVHLVNPGFVATPLTAGNAFEMPHLISADRAAQEILAGWARGEFEIHFPRRFSGLLKLLRCLPYRFYFPLIARRTG